MYFLVVRWRFSCLLFNTFSIPLMIDSIHEYLRPHLLCLVDAGDGCNLAVFVSSEYLTHGARGHAVGHTVDVDLFVLVNITHGRLFLSLWRWLAAIEVKRKQLYLPVRLYISMHTDVTCNVSLIMSQVHISVVYWRSVLPCQCTWAVSTVINTSLLHYAGVDAGI